jgi:hypothetical protein
MPTLPIFGFVLSFSSNPGVACSTALALALGEIGAHNHL